MLSSGYKSLYELPGVRAVSSGTLRAARTRIMSLSQDFIDEQIDIVGEQKVLLLAEMEGLLRAEEVLAYVNYKAASFSLEMTEEHHENDDVRSRAEEVLTGALKEFRLKVWPGRSGRDGHLKYTEAFSALESEWKVQGENSKKAGETCEDALWLEMPLEVACRLQLMSKIEAESEVLEDKFKDAILEAHNKSLLE